MIVNITLVVIWLKVMITNCGSDPRVYLVSYYLIVSNVYLIPLFPCSFLAFFTLCNSVFCLMYVSFKSSQPHFGISFVLTYLG